MNVHRPSFYSLNGGGSLRFDQFSLSQSSLDTVIWFCLMARDATQVLNLIFNNHNNILLSAEGNESVPDIIIVLRLLVLHVCPATFELHVMFGCYWLILEFVAFVTIIDLCLFFFSSNSLLLNKRDRIWGIAKSNCCCMTVVCLSEVVLSGWSPQQAAFKEVWLTETET